MSETMLRDDTVIEIGKSVPLYRFRAYFEEATGKKLSGAEFQPWLNTQAGKTFREALAAYGMESERKTMERVLSEGRFDILSEADKAFIIDFDKKMETLGYDFGGGIGDGYCWGKYMIIYSKTGAKSKKIIARIYIREDGITLRLFLNSVDKHQRYLENASEPIREVFVGSHGNCSCNPQKENCRMRKTYTIDGRKIEKCSGAVFEFPNPAIENCKDYIGLLEEFYPVKKAKVS